MKCDLCSVRFVFRTVFLRQSFRVGANCRRIEVSSASTCPLGRRRTVAKRCVNKHRKLCAQMAHTNTSGQLIREIENSPVCSDNIFECFATRDRVFSFLRFVVFFSADSVPIITSLLLQFEINNAATCQHHQRNQNADWRRVFSENGKIMRGNNTPTNWLNCWKNTRKNISPQNAMHTKYGANIRFERRPRA